ncbi:hypothetical protein AB0H49_17175 [Nocardia sp. NPDC050713]|uniref:hypothetical protein n=1 Tax=Nocardia sp. NPDC050713 TaxID=3154511 RepID=UPI0033C6902D
MHAPKRVRGLIVRNDDVYEDQYGPKYAPLERFWEKPTEKGKAELAEAVSDA